MAARRRITAKQRAASRRNIRKAQIASARKRRGTGKRPVRRSVRRPVARGPIRRTAVSRKPIRLPGQVKPSTAKRVAPVGTRVKVQRHVQRNRRRYKTAAGLVAGVTVAAGATGYGYDLHKNVRLYHNTDARNVAGIKATGLHGVKRGSFSHTRFQETPGDVFFAKGMNTTKMFGDHVVKVKMDRKYFNAHAKRDPKMPRGTRAYKIHESHVGKRPGVKYKVYRGGPIQRAQYKAMFPDGTKESYAMRNKL